jgi:hypothetical protein
MESRKEWIKKKPRRRGYVLEVVGDATLNTNNGSILLCAIQCFLCAYCGSTCGSIDTGMHDYLASAISGMASAL